MSNLEKRRHLRREIVDTARLIEVAGDHPLMGPLLHQREEEFRRDLKKLPSRGADPRAVLFFSGDPVYGSKGIDAKFASEVLPPFLEMVKTEYSTEKHGPVGQRGPRRGENEAKLMITAVPRGSFGFELAQPQTDDLFGEQRLSDVLVRLTSLVSSAAKSDEDFVHSLEEVSPRVHGRLGEFLRAISDNRANIRMQTGDLEFSLDREAVSRAVDRVASLETIESDIRVKGVFRGATLDTWRFDFRAEDGQELTGRLAQELTEDHVAQMLRHVNKPSIADLHETKVTTQGGAVRTRYELKNISPRRKKPTIRGHA